MDHASLVDYQALNDQLAALVEAGVLVDVGLPTSNRSVIPALEQIDTTVSRRVGRGERLDEALQGDDEAVPPAYRSLVQLGLRSGDNLAAGFAGSSRTADAIDRTRYAFESAMIYPLSVCGLAYLGLIGLCLYFVPVLEAMNDSLRFAPGTGLRVLQVLRDTMSYWMVILPLLVVLAVAWRLRAGWRLQSSGSRAGGLLRWIPGVSKSLFQERCARFADAFADLLDSGTPFDEALKIAADGSGDRVLGESAGRLSTAAAAGSLPGDESSTARRFPPFLRWAIWHSEATTGRTRALRTAAQLYRQAAERRDQRLRTLAPVLAVLLVGGTATLLYCLALFVPLTQLLIAIAK
jgi:type II secretory pathway component PulF